MITCTPYTLPIAIRLGARITVRIVSGRSSSAIAPKVQSVAISTAPSGSTTPRQEPRQKLRTVAMPATASGISSARSRSTR